MIAYILIAWISLAIGFIIGAAWAGLGTKNKEIENGLK